MKRFAWVILSVLIIFVSSMLPLPFTVAAQAKAVDSPLEELINGADSVVVGTVVEHDSYWNDEHTRIYTSVLLSIEERLKGTADRDRVIVTSLGGEVDEIGLLVSEMPRFDQGERVVVFLKKLSEVEVPKAKDSKLQLSEEQFGVYCGFRGKFAITGDKVGELPLAKFQERVNKVLNGQALSDEELDVPSSVATFPYSYAGYCWPHPPAPVVNYRINENCAECTGEGAAVQAAAATWNTAGAQFSFSYAGATTATVGGTNNGVNEILWRNLGSGDTVAWTLYWYSGSTLLDCDIEFNDYYIWSTAATPPFGEYDVQTVALHEFGHFLQLGHSSDINAVMYYQYQGMRRALHADDIAGIQYIYGVAPTPPNAPSNLIATPISSSRIDLTWQDNSGDETGFKIERKTGAGGTWSQIASVSAGVTSYSNTGLAAGTTYYYRVRAYNAGGNSDYSNEASATTLPPPPCSCGGTNNNYEWISRVQFNTIDKSSGGNGYADYTSVSTPVYRGNTYSLTVTIGQTGSWQEYVRAYFDWNRDGDFEDGGEGIDIGHCPSNGCIVSADITIPGGATLGSTRMRIVQQYNSYHGPCGSYTYGDTEDYTVNIQVVDPPTAPSNLIATPISSSRIDLTWQDNSGDETGFKIERKTGSGSYSQIATVGVGVTSHSDTGLTASTTYYYRVRAYNAGGNSGYSNEASATTLPPPPPPTAPSNLIATPISSSQIDLTWQDNSDNETGFKIERKTGSGSYSQIATVGAGVTSYSDPSLTAGTTYYYRVRAYNAGGDSGYSNEASATTPLPPPVYCSCGGTNNNYEWISRVQFNTIDKSSGGNGYADYTSISTNVYRGNTYTLTVTTGQTGSWQEYVRAYFDWNQDGDFGDSGEGIDIGHCSSNGCTVSADITIPGGATLGSTRMRIVQQYNSYHGPCGSYTYGDTEDYTVNIQVVDPLSNTRHQVPNSPKIKGQKPK